METKSRNLLLLVDEKVVHHCIGTKRRFQGNRYTKSASTNENTSSNEQVDRYLSASYKKIKSSSNIVANPASINNNSPSFVAAAADTEMSEVTTTPNTFISDSSFLLIDKSVLKDIINCVGICPSCQSTNIIVNIDPTKKKGLSLPISLSCSMCKWSTIYYTSTKIENHSKVKSCYEVNVRAVMAMREIGSGHTALEKLCGFLNLPEPPHITTVNDIQKNIADAYNNVAFHSMISAASEIEGTKDENGICDITVSCDGTWQKRGYSSLKGIVTVISGDTGKCIDYRIRTKNFKTCQSWEGREGTDEYEQFISTHEPNCDINHQGSAGSVEAAGLIECFQVSEKDRKLRYINYLGDGDSKSFSEISKLDIYPQK